MFEVLFFRTEAGNEPVRSWLRSLEAEERAVIGADLRTAQIGFPLGMPLCRALGGGLYEVRSSLPTRKEARVIFFQTGATLVLVHGFIKKTQSTPRAEIDKAARRKAEYEANEKH
jgi:phage-related protein